MHLSFITPDRLLKLTKNELKKMSKQELIGLWLWFDGWRQIGSTKKYNILDKPGTSRYMYVGKTALRTGKTMKNSVSLTHKVKDKQKLVTDIFNKLIQLAETKRLKEKD
jgi:hypothetical protein